MHELNWDDIRYFLAVIRHRAWAGNRAGFDRQRGNAATLEPLEEGVDAFGLVERVAAERPFGARRPQLSRRKLAVDRFDLAHGAVPASGV